MPRKKARDFPGLFLDGWKLAIFALFVASRLVLVMVEARGAQVGAINLTYAYEMQRAAALGKSFYEMHSEKRGEAEPSSALVERVVEYPPLAVQWMALPTRFMKPIPNDGPVSATSMKTAELASRAAMFAVDSCGFALLVLAGATAARLAFYTVSGLLLFPFLLDRFDAVLGVMVLAAMLLLCRKFPIWAPLAMLALAISFKVTPIVLVPLFLFGTLPADALTQSARSVAGLLARRALLLALFGAVMFLPFFAKDGWATLDFLKYHSARGLEIEAVWSTLPILLGAVFRQPSAVVFRYVSMELQSGVTGPLIALANLATAAVTPVLAVTLWRLLRGRAERPERKEGATLAQANPVMFVGCALASLLTAMVLAKVLSPQYMLWLIPLAALWEGKRERLACAAFLVICALTTLVYPFSFGALEDAARVSPRRAYWYRVLSAGPVVTRNLLLVGIAVWCWRNAAQKAGVGSGETTPDQLAGERAGVSG